MATLYRKYRPQNFQEVVGQTATKHTLENALISGNIVHSYLFSGPRGTGKTTIARIFAKSLNCLNREPTTSEPCNQCQACQAINQNAFVDLIEIDAASNRGIDEIRSLKEAIRFAPSYRHGYKIYIIDEAHMLTKDASNALLKTLEEPPENVIFILATTDPQKLLPTILSRTQRFDFTSLSASDIKTKLQTIAQAEHISIDETVLDRVVMMAMGGARDAESLLGKLLSQQTEYITAEIADAILGKTSIQEIYQLFRCIGDNDLPSSLQQVHTLFDSGYHIDQVINQSIAIARQLLLASISPHLIDNTQLLETEQELIQHISTQQPSQFWAQLLEHLEDHKADIHQAYLPIIPLELALIQSFTYQTTESQPESSPSTQPPQSSSSSSSSQSTSFTKDSSPSKASSSQSNSSSLSPPSSSEKTNPFRSSSHPPSPPPKSHVQEEPESYSAIDLSTIKSQQNALRQAISKHNKTLVSVFDKARPIDYQNSRLTFYVDSEFYRSRLEKHISELQDICRSVWKMPEMTIHFTSTKQDSEPSSPKDTHITHTVHSSETTSQSSNTASASTSNSPQEPEQTAHNLESKDPSPETASLPLKEKVTSVFHDYLEDQP